MISSDSPIVDAGAVAAGDRCGPGAAVFTRVFFYILVRPFVDPNFAYATMQRC